MCSRPDPDLVSEGLQVDVMCSRPDPDLISEGLQVDEPEADDHNRDKEFLRGRSVESARGSGTSDGASRPGETLGDLVFSSEKFHPTSISVTSDLSTRSSASLNEEQFEDFGEGGEPDFLLDDETRTNGCSDLGSSVSSSAAQTPCRLRNINSEQVDVYCCQCSRKINLLNDLEARLKHLRANSPSRKITSTAFGRQLLHNSNFSSRNGSSEDLFRDSVDALNSDISEKVSSLEKKVSELEEEILADAELKSKLKLENTQLVHRVHRLEEQMKEQETRADQSLREELRRHRDAFVKLERDKNSQLELMTNRLNLLEEENAEMTVNMYRLKSQTEKLDQEKQRMTDKLEDTSLRLRDEMDLYKKMMDKLRQNRQQFQMEKDDMQELIQDLRKELENLQLFKLEAETPGRRRRSSSSLLDFCRTREMELDYDVKRLKQENQRLKDHNDELNAQMLSLSLYEAKNLFATPSKAQSLAAEIENASREQLLEALKEQEEINGRLRQYMDKIILSILDHNPSILEIKN